MTIRDAAFLAVTEALYADGFPADIAPWTSPVSLGADQSAQLGKVLEDLIAAESWESMAMRSVTRSTPQTSNPRHAPGAQSLRTAC